MMEARENGTFTDFYAKCEDRCVITNITELIACAETDEALCFCDSEGKYRRRESSDFEYFSELMRILPELEGTHVCENIRSILCEICGIEALDGALSESDICSLWTLANEKMFSLCDGEYVEFLKKYGAEKLYFDEFALIENDCVGKYYDSGTDTIFVYNMKKLDFVRPDPYHYDCALKKQNNGEKLNNKEISTLLAQTLYLKLAEKQRGKIQLHLRADSDGKTARELISYFKGRRFPLEIYLAFEGEGSVENTVSLCLLSDEIVKVRPEILLTRTDSFANLCDRMKLLFAAYPYKNVTYGGTDTNSPAFFLGYRLYKRAIERVVGDF